ncbi:hypothetical protein [Sporofaciens musculi]|uniref:hypothetical protein n=1 Tax=Sporofaciens musculi TaxID=2681861 RepID=UPI0025709BBB|nr:hypothetical protein [Sporofaciens musculi]
MSFTIYVRMKKPGRRILKELPPTPFVLNEKPETLRELLVGLTELGVKDYNARKDEGGLLPFLTKEAIANQAVQGKVSFGVHGGAKANATQAVENTFQSFEDGIYRVFAGNEEMTGLDDKVPWKEGLVFTLIRLTMLSG